MLEPMRERRRRGCCARPGYIREIARSKARARARAIAAEETMERVRDAVKLEY